MFSGGTLKVKLIWRETTTVGRRGPVVNFTEIRSRWKWKTRAMHGVQGRSTSRQEGFPWRAIHPRFLSLNRTKSPAILSLSLPVIYSTEKPYPPSRHLLTRMLAIPHEYWLIVSQKPKKEIIFWSEKMDKYRLLPCIDPLIPMRITIRTG